MSKITVIIDSIAENFDSMDREDKRSVLHLTNTVWRNTNGALQQLEDALDSVYDLLVWSGLSEEQAAKLLEKHYAVNEELKEIQVSTDLDRFR